MRYGTLLILAFALVMCLWSLVLGVKELGSSVPGGIAVILISILVLGGIAWRMRFSWKRIHEAD
jgi:hypothetical protein